MRAVVQRVTQASVSVDGVVTGSVAGAALVVLLGVTHDDSEATARAIADKIWHLRVFEGPDGSEVSAADVGAGLLVISQFTLYGDARKGRRPTWTAAAPGPVAEPLYEAVVARLRELGASVDTGVFGAQMQVSLTNDGPFTLVLEV